jgi:hypothetical protein
VSAFSRKPVRIGPERCPESSGTGVRFRPDYALLRQQPPNHPAEQALLDAGRAAGKVYVTKAEFRARQAEEAQAMVTLS